MPEHVETKPTIGEITTARGVAGEVQYTARVTYPSEDTSAITFSGTTYGAPGPVVMITARGQVFVTNPDRFGARFDQSWVRAFFGCAL